MGSCIGASNKLTWNVGVFGCETDQTGAGGGISDVKLNGTNVVTSATDLNFTGNGFLVTDQGNGVAGINIDWTNGPASRSTANNWTALNTFSASPLGLELKYNTLDFTSFLLKKH